MKKQVNPLPFFSLFKDFIKCGVIGWCMEIVFTAIGSLRRREMQLVGQTSLYMFPIYGCAAFFKPAFFLVKNLSFPLRGLFYAASIFTAEFLSGTLLSKYSVCPWNYGRHRWHVNGLIRLDFLPLWSVAGLLFEHVLIKPMAENTDKTLRGL
ncbi:MAG: putative ABC transporter permease [Lachnospiraceae bacterium]|jgi:Protein of unknown function (DUF1113).|nr:putative ABC transporter permease [Lachnospiraceae bacterium]